jgi:CBS domain-containing protein
MKVSDVMTRNVELAEPGQSISAVAKQMADSDAGFIPVGENDRLIGMITDRDIAVRAVAAGKGPDTPVREVMTREVNFCYEDEPLGKVAKNMAEIKVRRLPVMDRGKRLVGVITLGDIAQADKRAAGVAISGTTSPGGPHS